MALYRGGGGVWGAKPIHLCKYLKAVKSSFKAKTGKPTQRVAATGGGRGGGNQFHHYNIRVYLKHKKL